MSSSTVPRSGTAPVGLYGSTAGANLVRSATAEMIGTFVLVLAGTATAVAAAATQPAVYDLIAVVLAFGIALTAMASALGHVSGCHLNPAVTLSLAVTGKFPWRAVPGYVVAQLGGAVLASLAVWAAYGQGRGIVALSVTAPTDGVGTAQAVFVEALVTFVLVLTVISVATDARVPGGLAPIAVGAALAVSIVVAGPLTGGAVNPARAFGPAIVSGTTGGLWIYLVAPVVGGILAAVVYDKFLAPAAPPSTEE